MTAEVIPDVVARRLPKRVHDENPATLADAWRVFFKYPSPRVMTALMILSVGAKVFVGGWSTWDLAVVAAVAAFWPVQEWLIHVFILHLKPFTILGRRFHPLTSQKHRAHHQDPWRLELVFIPTHILPFAGPLVFAFYFLVLPTLPLALTGLAAFFLLSFHYEWVHYFVHTRYKPRSAYYLRLWKNHRLHHFMNENYWYGVTMLSGDKLLRTGPARDAVEPSTTCRTLGQMDDLGGNRGT
jgi:hypothetical protein